MDSGEGDGMSDICPKCKKENQGFIIYGRIGGRIPQFYNSIGIYAETDLDKMYWTTNSNAVRCANCGKIRKDVLRNNNIIQYIDGTDVKNG